MRRSGGLLVPWNTCGLSNGPRWVRKCAEFAVLFKFSTGASERMSPRTFSSRNHASRAVLVLAYCSTSHGCCLRYTNVTRGSLRSVRARV